MGTAAAFLACYCPLCLSAPGKPSDPGIPSKFLPAEPGIQQGASRRSHVLVHVDSRDALVHHSHTVGHLLQRQSTMGTSAPPARAPDQYRRLTHAHAAATGGTRHGAPAPFFTTASNGPNSYGDGRRHATATVHLRPRPHPPDPGKNPGRPRPETRQWRKGTQFSSHHGRAAKRRMYFFTGTTDPAGLAQIADTLSQPAAIGRLGQACDRWIYTACLCFGLDLADQQASGFRYAYSVCQAEYSRNLIFASGARMDRVFGTIAGRTRSRLDVPALRTLSGVRQRPAGTAGPSLKLAVVTERPKYDLTLFKVHFGLLTLKGYTKG